MNSVRHKLLMREAGDEVKVLGFSGRQCLREASSDLSQVLLVPGWPIPVQRRSQNDLKDKKEVVKEE